MPIKDYTQILALLLEAPMESGRKPKRQLNWVPENPETLRQVAASIIRNYHQSLAPHPTPTHTNTSLPSPLKPHDPSGGPEAQIPLTPGRLLQSRAGPSAHWRMMGSTTGVPG